MKEASQGMLDYALTDRLSELASQASQDLQELIGQNALDLPILPQVAQRVRLALDPLPQVEQDLVDLVSLAPALSASLVKLANSPIFCAPQQVEDVSAAVRWLGLETAGSLACDLAMANVFQAVSHTVNKKLHEASMRAVAISRVAGQIARDMTNLSVPQAELAGLTHNLGTLPILVWAENHRGQVSDDATLQALIDALQSMLGNKLLASWGFPAHLCSLPTECELLGRRGAETDLVDLVQIASVLCLRGSDHPWARLDWRRLPAFNRLGVDSEQAYAALELRCTEVLPELSELGPASTAALSG